MAPTAAELAWMLRCAAGAVALRVLFGPDAWLAAELLAVAAAVPWLARLVLAGRA